MVLLRSFGGEQFVRGVAVTLRANAAADHERRLRALVPLADFLHQLDRSAVQGIELGDGVAEPRRPGRARAPRRALEHETDAELAGQLGVAGVVAPERLGALFVPEQVDGGELRQVEAVVEDERRLETAIRHEQPTVELR